MARTCASAFAVSRFRMPPISCALTTAWSGIEIWRVCPLPDTARGPRVTRPTIRHLIVGVLICANNILTLVDGTQTCPGWSIVHRARGTAASSALLRPLSGALIGTAMTDRWAGTTMRSVARGGAWWGTRSHSQATNAPIAPSSSSATSAMIRRIGTGGL